jgi:hypothetical protein
VALDDAEELAWALLMLSFGGGDLRRGREERSGVEAALDWNEMCTWSKCALSAGVGAAAQP